MSLVARDKASQDLGYSTQILYLIPAGEVKSLPVTHLPWLFAGLCQRFLYSNDGLAMMSAEQLVDAMDMDESWCDRNLMNASPPTRQLASRVVKGKQSRLDAFTGKKVTCFVANIEEAQILRFIPGYEQRYRFPTRKSPRIFHNACWGQSGFQTFPSFPRGINNCSHISTSALVSFIQSFIKLVDLDLLIGSNIILSGWAYNTNCWFGRM